MPDLKKTKIIATLGPASEQHIKELITEGVDIFRFNMKHGTIEWHEKHIEEVQRIATECKRPIGILIDLQGPEIRVQTKDQKPLELKKGDLVRFSSKFHKNLEVVRIPHKSVLGILKKGDKFSIDDGFVQLEVKKKDSRGIIAELLHDGTIGHKKSLNLYLKDVNLPSLIKDDLDNLHVAARKKVDYIALSFVRNKEDLKILRKHMKKKGIDAQVIAKIETQKAIDNIDEIVKESDAVMVARGDLGVETPIERLAFYQKTIINKCRAANTPVIVATQMLESMVLYPFPTRAEVTDVANAVLDGADALMLSEETALGKYPVKTVQEMAKIAQFNEEKSNVIRFDIKPQNATELIVEAAENIAENSQKVKIDHIVVFTETGYTARVLSSYRPQIPVIAATDIQKTVETLTLSFGITPVRVKLPKGVILSPDKILEQLKDMGYVKKGEMALVIHGQHYQVEGQTNAIVLVSI